MAYFTRSKDFVCSFVPSCDSYSKSVLLTTPTNVDSPELIDKENEFLTLNDTEGFHRNVGDSIWYVRDGIDKKGYIINMLLDPSRTQLLYNVKCKYRVIQTTREFLKFVGDKEVAIIPQTTDDYIQQCK